MLLAIETSSRAGSVACLDFDGRVLEARPLSAPRDHAQGLAPTIRALFPDGISAIEAYAISIGPGSFTGLRIGVAFLKGLAVAHPRPTWAVSSLEVLAAGAGDESNGAARLAVVDARRGNVFAARFGADLAPDPALPEGMYPVDQIQAGFGQDPDLRWTGDGAPLFEPAGPVADPEAWIPRAEVLGARALAARALRPGLEPFEIAPIYHQLSAAEEKAGVQAVPG